MYNLSKKKVRTYRDKKKRKHSYKKKKAKHGQMKTRIRNNVKREYHISKKVLKRFSRLLDHIVPNQDYKKLIQSGDMDFLKLLKHQMRKDKVLGNMKDSGVRKIYKGLDKSITYCDSFSDAWRAPADCQCRDGQRKVRKHKGTRSEGWGCESETHHYTSSPSIYRRPEPKKPEPRRIGTNDFTSRFRYQPESRHPEQYTGRLPIQSQPQRLSFPTISLEPQRDRQLRYF